MALYVGGPGHDSSPWERVCGGLRPSAQWLRTVDAAAAAGPAGPVPGTLIVYTALDREFSVPILETYGQKTGVRILPKFDVESTKTVGLTNQIIAEAARPAMRPVLE